MEKPLNPQKNNQNVALVSNEQIASLQAAVEKLTKKIEIKNSVRHSFLLAIINGVGSVIGAGIVAGILIAFLVQVLSSLDNIPAFNLVIDTKQAQEQLQQFVPSQNGK